MGPISLSIAAAYVAKVGGPKIAGVVADVVRKRGWARRVAQQGFRGFGRPRPLRATAEWIRLPQTLRGVLLPPDMPGEHAVASLDEHLCRESKRWRVLPQEERERRLAVVLGVVYNSVLTEHEPGWATMISTGRILSAERQTYDAVLQLQQTAEAQAATVSDTDLDERLAVLPAQHRAMIGRRWREAKDDVWLVIVALTTFDSPPTAVAAQWQSACPEWLTGAALPARLVAADLVWAYDAPRLAADLYRSAAQEGAPRAKHWAARSALILDELGDRGGARAVIEEFRDLPPDLLFSAVAAAIGEEWDRLRETLALWCPTETVERALRFVLYNREVMLGRGKEFLTREALDEVLRAGQLELGDQYVPGISLQVARLLILRTKRGESDHPYTDLKFAREAAVRARDERRVARSDSADAVEVACDAAIAAGDFDAVIALGDLVEGEATEDEATASAVRQYVLLAHAARGDAIGEVHPEDAVTPFASARLGAALAERRGDDTTPFWHQALTAAAEDHERATALVGLARAGATSLPGLDELAAMHPDLAREIRAVADLAQGREDQAIAAIRTLAPTSITAATTLASAYRQAGDVDGELATLRAAALDFHEPQFRFEAALVLARSGDRAGAGEEVRSLLATAPPAWPRLADAQRLAAQLALDSGDVVRATELLRAAVATAPRDASTRWALIRLLLARSDYPAAWRVLREHPEPLEPTTPDDARGWIEVHREHAPGEETVRGCVRLMRQFPDSEEIRAAAILAVVGTGTSQEPLPDDLLADFHAAVQEFTDRWPESRLFFVVSAPDGVDLVAAMDEVVRTTPEQQRAHRELATNVLLGQLPIGSLAASLGRSYAEVVLRRGLDVIPARHPDPAEHALCLQAARVALNKGVAVDTTALVVIDLLNAEVAAAAQGRYRLVTVDDVLADARAARRALTASSPGRLAWDEQAQASRYIETDSEAASELADAAQSLVKNIEQLRRLPRPAPTDQRFAESIYSPWFPVIDLARAEGAALWADDGALRLLARGEGVPAFSTPAMLQVMEDDGALLSSQREDIDRALIRGFVGDLPVLSGPGLLMELAEDDHWKPGCVSAALGRPAVWTDPWRTLDAVTPLLQAIQANAPETLPGWLYRLVRGAAYAHLGQPDMAHLAIAPLVASVAYLTGAQGMPAAALVAACRAALHDTGYQSSGAQDPIATATLLMYRVMNRVLPRQDAAQHMLGFAASLDPGDRDLIVRMVFTG